MSLEAFLDVVSQDDFATLVNLASDDRMAFTIVSGSPSVNAIVDFLRKEPEKASDALRMIREIAEKPVDPRYQSPYDAILLALLIAVERSVPEAAQLAASLVQRAPQTWWAVRRSQRLLLERVQTSTAGVIGGEPAVNRVSSGESLVVGGLFALALGFLVVQTTNSTPLSGDPDPVLISELKIRVTPESTNAQDQSIVGELKR